MEERKKKLYAASKNKQPIVEVLVPRIRERLEGKDNGDYNIVEIASGTGEHCAHFMQNISSRLIHYQPTEIDQTMFESIQAWISETGLVTESRLLSPIVLDVTSWRENIPKIPFEPGTIDVIICINMIHISPWSATINLFSFASSFLRKSPSDRAFLITYGPYCINGEMVESNHAFSQSLKERNPEWGVRELEDIKQLAVSVGMELQEIVPMPSNNHCLIWSMS